MTSHKQRNNHKLTNLDNLTPGLAYRFTNKDAQLLNLKPSQSLPSLSSPESESFKKRHPQSNKPPDPSPPHATPDQITIRVIDDAHALTKNFICPASLLLSSMTYFRDNLSSYQDNWQDIDISVHCDLQVFSWLMDYITSSSNSSSRSLPKLDAKRVFSVLVSSEYLGMPDLVETCILFISENINAVLAMHSSTECLNQLAIDKLSGLLSCAQLQQIQDPKDLIQDKLFTSKLRLLMDTYTNDDSRPFTLNSVYKCLDCQNCVVSGLESLFLCGSNSAQIRVSQQGSLFYVHRRDPVWSVRGELEELRRQGTGARDRFWRAWGYSHLLFCSACKYSFIACDINSCTHIGQSKFRSSQSSFSLIPSLLPSDRHLHCLEGDRINSVFEDKIEIVLRELITRSKDVPERSVWTCHVFDSSVNELALKFSHLIAATYQTNILQDSASSASLSEIQLFSQNASSTSLTRSQFYCLKEETVSLPANPSKHRPPNRSASRDSNALKNFKVKPFTGSVNGELEMGMEGEEDEKSEADSKTVSSSLTKSRSISSQYSLCSEDAKYNTSTWNNLCSRKNNIDLQRETEYTRSLKVAQCVQNLVISKQDIRHTHNQQTNSSISDRIERNFKAGLTSNKLQKYQQTTNPKLKKNYPCK